MPLRIGIEIGGTKLQAALGTPEGEILATERMRSPAEAGAEAILACFTELVPRLLERPEARNAGVAAMGVGFGGPVDSATGTALVSHQVGGWDGFPLKAWFEDRFHLPTVVANDSNAAGWAEYCLGAGRDTRTFCYMNIGSGIGGALIIDGRLHDGQGRGAAEIGHTYVPDWTASAQGAYDKLEHLCSGWAIERRMRESGHPMTCAELAEAARQGDPKALAELDRTAGYIAVALANVLALLHPERIAVGGGVGLMGDVLFDPLRRHVDRIVFGPYRGRYEIVPCALGESVVLAGAILLAQH